MGRTACTEPQCLYKGDLYLYLYVFDLHSIGIVFLTIAKVRGENMDSLNTRVFIITVPSFHWESFVLRLVRKKP